MKKILIVDDDPDIVEAMRMVLEAQNFEVHSASTGPMAQKGEGGKS